jgi:2-polyprenyl-3-methyl-5-hydroxy-6-metoxy-1,4-benzoquinol methylase
MESPAVISAYYQNVRADMRVFVPGDAKSVLDVGCGEGEFGASLRPREVWGVEPTEAATIAATKLDRVIHGQFSPKEIDRTFDVVCFNDVLEHLPDPDLTLRETKAILNTGGCVIASIPNVLFFYNITNILLTQDWRYEDAGIMDRTHLRFFTKKSIVRLFESNGYRIDVIKGISESYGLKYSAANLLTLGRLKDWKYVQFAVRAKMLNGD